MLSPKLKSNLKKFRKGRISCRVRLRGSFCNFGSFGLQSLAAGFLTSRQIETGRRVLKKFLKKRGRFWLNIFPDVARTKKAEKTRMGKGKGRLHLWCFKARPGKMLFEIGGVNPKNARVAFQKLSFKLPVRTRCVVQ